MNKKITNYTFVPWNRYQWYIQFNDYSSTSPLLLSDIVSIRNITRWVTYYDFEDQLDPKNSRSVKLVNWNRVYLMLNNWDHSSSDDIQILLWEGNLINPWVGAFAITPSDSTNLSSVPREIYVWVGGNIAVTFVEWGTVTLLNVPDGGRLPYRVSKVFSTWTTATNLIAIL